MKYVPFQLSTLAIAMSLLASLGCSSGFQSPATSQSAENNSENAAPAPLLVGGICGPANGTTVASAPINSLCLAGSPSLVTGMGPYIWSCSGANGGTNANCSAQRASTVTPTAGQCGTANLTTVTTAPTVNLCVVGTASGVSGQGPFNWTCSGLNGGAAAACSAQLMVAVPGSKCGMQSATGSLAFCETFDSPSPVTGRSGELNQKLWGVSRGGLEFNIGSPFAWANTKLNKCGTIVNAVSPDDNGICNGRLVESLNDNISGDFDAGGVAMKTFYPKQPFDFSGRTGTVAFDMSNDSTGSHSAWPEFWITDQPVPLPITHFSALGAPANALAVRFDAVCPPGQFCACGSNPNYARFTVGSFAVVRDWFVEDEGFVGCMDGAGKEACVKKNLKVEILDCVRSASGPNGDLNHIEIKVSKDVIEVFATDPGSTVLKKIARATGADLSFSRGFIWLQNKHYNADKGVNDAFPISQRDHTFAWDNVAFDGPLVARDLSFDVLDSLVPGNGFKYLGFNAYPNKPAQVSTLAMTSADIAAAKTASLLFNFYHRETPSTFTYSINGHVHNASWPFPERTGFTLRTISLPIALSDLVPGANQIVIYADQAMEVGNINISLAGAGGIVPPK